MSRIASASKTGRNPKLPYVPVIIIKTVGRDISSQIRGFAFATRAEAIAFAKATIEYNDTRCNNS